MTSDATPSRRPNYSRPTRFPARLALMLTTEQREAIEKTAIENNLTLGEAARALIDTGLIYFVPDNG